MSPRGSETEEREEGGDPLSTRVRGRAQEWRTFCPEMLFGFLFVPLLLIFCCLRSAERPVSNFFVLFLVWFLCFVSRLAPCKNKSVVGGETTYNWHKSVNVGS